VFTLACEDVDGAGVEERVVALIAVDTGRSTRLVWRTDSHRRAVSAERHALTGVPLKYTAASEMVVSVGVRRFQIVGLRDLYGTR
jgi:hypothetical protein